ncbi:MAG: SLC13 family permease [Nitrospiraceae bacterium]
MTKFALKILPGPLVFLVVLLLVPLEGLPYSGRLALALFLWTVLWWVTQPLPWGITALLPLVMYPLLAIMPIGATFRLYGQGIFFWIMGMALLGYAMEKHGLAKRFALRLLSIKGIANTTLRLAFFHMLATGLISMFISDIATIAMMIPIGVSVVSYARTIHAGSESPLPAKRGSPLGSFFALGTLYAALAGGIGTIAGLAHNALSISLLETLTGRTITWFQWMKMGVPTFLTLLVVFYFILRFFFPPEFHTISGGQEFIRSERAKLGKMSRAEINVTLVFCLMVLLFALPSLVGLLWGQNSTLALGLKEALPIWGVPPIVLFLLFGLPENTKTGKPLLTWKDAVEHSPWSIMLLCAGAVAQTDALVQFGFMEFMKSVLSGIETGSATFPLVVALVVAVMTELVSGTATTLVCGGLFIPLATQIGANPVSIAMVIPNVALGIVFPWAGAAAGTAFASGEIEMKDMIKAGLVASAGCALIVGLIHIVFSSSL